MEDAGITLGSQKIDDTPKIPHDIELNFIKLETFEDDVTRDDTFTSGSMKMENPLEIPNETEYNLESNTLSEGHISDHTTVIYERSAISVDFSDDDIKQNITQQIFMCRNCNFKNKFRLTKFESNKSRKYCEPLHIPCKVPCTVHSCHFLNHSIANHTDIQCYKCSHCKNRAVKSCHLKKQLMTKNNKTLPITCPHCEYSTINSCHLKKHIMDNHTDIQPYNHESGAATSSHKKHLIVKNKTPAFKCPQCEYSTIKSCHLKKHKMVNHTEIQPYNHDSGASKSCDKKHLLAKNNKTPPLKCPHCEYNTVYACHLKKHIMVNHTSTRPSKCPHGVNEAAKLCHKKHVMTKNNKTTPFKCPHCEYSTSCGCHLQKHINVNHTKTRPCRNCAAKFCHKKHVPNDQK